jgi:hypothetical protein
VDRGWTVGVRFPARSAVVILALRPPGARAAILLSSVSMWRCRMGYSGQTAELTDRSSPSRVEVKEFVDLYLHLSCLSSCVGAWA